MPQSEWEKPSVLGLVEEPAWSRAVKRLLKKKIFMAILSLLVVVLVIINLVFHRVMDSFIINPIMVVNLLAGIFFIIAFFTLRQEISDIKLTDAEIRESESRYRTLIEQASDGILVGDGQGRITVVNTRACEMLGYTRDELMSLKRDALFLPGNHAGEKTKMDEIRAGKVVIMERRLRRKDGTTIAVETSSKMFSDGKMQAIVRDITERKKAEAALRENENKYRTLMEQAPDGIFVGDKNGNVLEVNSKACMMLGYTRDELLQLTMQDLILAEDFAITPHTIEELYCGREVLGERRLRRKDGTIIYTEISAKQLEDGRIQAIVRDITEHKQAEEALCESEERFRSLVQTAAGIIICLTPEYRIIEFNSEAERFFGCDRQEVLGKDYFELFLPETVRDLVAADIKKALEGEPSRGSEYTLKISDGRKRVMMWNLSRLLDAREEPVGVIAVGQDMTCRKRAEEKIGRLNNLYTVLSKINETIVRIREPEKLYQEACRIAVEDGLFLAAWIGLVDPDTRLVNPVASWGVVNGYLDNITVSAGSDVQEGQGIVGTTIREGRYQICNDCEDDPRVLPWCAEALKMGFRSVAAFPLQTGSRIAGAFVLHADRRYFFNDDEVRLLDTLAGDISFAINSIEQERARSKAEAMLKEHELYLNSILQSAHDAFVTIDAEGKIIFWNDGAERIYGYSSDEIINKPFTTILPERISLPHWDAFHRRLLADNLITDEKPWKTVGLRKDGTEVPLEGSYSSFKAGGRVFFTVVIRSQNL